MRSTAPRSPAAPGALRWAEEAEVLRFARTVEGTAPAEYALGTVVLKGRKGGYGCVVELLFGLDCDNRPEADFTSSGIELKATKLERIRSRWEVGERTSVHMIDYERLPDETWSRATIKKKLAKIIFCFYRWIPADDPLTWMIDKVYYWRPDEQQWEYLKADWEYIRARCAAGEAHLLSERDTFVLGAATKAADSTKLRRQLGGGTAKPRVFSLKQPFVRALYDAACGRPAAASLVKTLRIRRIQAFEATLEDRLHAFEGRSVGGLAKEYGVAPTTAKQFSAMVVGRTVRRLLGIADPRARIREFEEFGIEMHVVPVKANGKAKEALSFPGFRYRALLDETWETSDLRSRLNRLLIVPIHEPARAAPLPDWRLGHAFFWTPTDAEMDQIEAEWEMFRDEIRSGRADRLTTASQTRILHVRPKARNSDDTDEAPGVGPVVKKTFWLNQPFLAELVLRNSAGLRVLRGRRARPELRAVAESMSRRRGKQTGERPA